MNVSLIISGLKKRLGGETSVVAGTLIMQNGLRLAGSMVMTRLLTAEAFGIIGVITSVLVTFALISDIGITAFIIRHRGAEDENFVNELWTLRLIRSIVLTVGVLAFSAPIANFLGKPELVYAIAISSLTFVIDGLDSLGALLALRGRKITRLSQLDILSQVINLGLTILLAALLRSYWAILLGNMVSQILRVWLSYYMFPGVRHRWRFSKVRAQEMWTFSRYITASTILTLIIRQSDKIVLAKVFSLNLFGIYIIAAGLAAVPTGIAGAYGARILLPRYGETARNNPEALKARYYSERILFHLMYAAGVGVLAGCAPIAVSILYDPRYQEAAFYLQILLLGSFFAFSNAAANDVMIVSGKSYFTLSSNVVRLAYFSTAGLAAFLYMGALGLILVVATIEMVAQVYAWVVLRKLQLFDLPRELAIIGSGLAGLALGFLLNSVLLWGVRMVGLKIG